MELYHGAHDSLVKHIGLCLTEDKDIASAFGPVVTTVEIRDDVRVYDDVPYDHDENSHPSDSDEYCTEMAKRYDLLRYEDEDDRGRRMTCYRILRPDIIEGVTSND